MSTIQWTNETWNPVTGCSKVSQGCKNCYAERLWPRVYGFRQFTDVRFHADRLDKPLKWKAPRMIFVNSMSDLFHEKLDYEQIRQVFDVMRRAKQHTFQVLTKRPQRMIEFLSHQYGEMYDGEWERDFGHVWLGVSVEDQKTADERIPLLLRWNEGIHWISAEPLLGPISIPVWLGRDIDPSDENREYPGIDWVVVGGESGPLGKIRSMDLRWVYDLKKQCEAEKVPLFVKQFGRAPIFSGGDGLAATTNLQLADSHGGNMAEWPEDLRIREFPSERGA